MSEIRLLAEVSMLLECAQVLEGRVSRMQQLVEAKDTEDLYADEIFTARLDVELQSMENSVRHVLEVCGSDTLETKYQFKDQLTTLVWRYQKILRQVLSMRNTLTQDK